MESSKRHPWVVLLPVAVVAALGFWGILQFRSSGPMPEQPRPRAAAPLPPPEERPSVPDPAAAPSAVPAAAPPRSTSVAPPSTTRPPKEIASIKARILDETSPPQKRVEALRELRVCSDDWKEPSIVMSMSELLRRSEFESVRTNLCRTLRGADTPIFRQQLLTSVVSDTASGVRREAAASLRGMATDPFVQDTLRKALATEPNSSVKDEIERTLIAGRPR